MSARPQRLQRLIDWVSFVSVFFLGGDKSHRAAMPRAILQPELLFSDLRAYLQRPTEKTERRVVNADLFLLVQILPE